MSMSLVDVNYAPPSPSSQPYDLPSVANVSLWRDLAAALRKIDQIYSRAIEPLGLTVVEWHLLQALYEHDGQHASTLARAVGRAATAFTPVLDKLQAKDLIWREPDNHDRRAVHIYLTPKAQTYRQPIHETARQIEGQILDCIKDNDYAALRCILAQLREINSDEAVVSISTIER